MSEAREFFRRCPGCGRRFHVKLTGEKLVDERKTTREPTETSRSPVTFGQFGGPGTSVLEVNINDNVPVTIDVKDFQYAYRCKQCGHTWSEIRTKESRQE